MTHSRNIALKTLKVKPLACQCSGRSIECTQIWFAETLRGLASLYSIFNGEEVFTLDNLQIIYQYFDKTQRKQIIQKSQAKFEQSNVLLFIYIKSKDILSFDKWRKNKNLQRLISAILTKYNEELVNAIKQMILIMINIAYNEGYDLEKMVEDLNQLVVKKLKEN